MPEHLAQACFRSIRATNLITMPRLKRALEQLPKAAQEFKDMIMTMGGSVDANGVANACPKLRNKASVAMKAMMDDDSKQKWAAMPQGKEHEEARHQWIADYLLDPKIVTCTGINTTSRRSQGGTKAATVWVTLNELAGPAHMNSYADAKVAVTSMQSRLHKDNSAMAAAGINQYKHTIFKEVSNQLKEQKVEAVAEASMDSESYQNVCKHMANPSNPGDDATRPSKKLRKEPKAIKDDPDRTPEKVAWKAHTTNKGLTQQ
jgi:hypothetical protein